MHKGIALADSPVRERVHPRCTHNLLPAPQLVAQVFHVVQREIDGRSADMRGEHCPGNARPLQQALLVWAQALDLGFEHLAQPLWHPELDSLQRHPQMPAAMLPCEETLLGQVVQRRHHEQRIALRVPIDQPGQALRQAGSRRLRREIGRDVRFAQRLQRHRMT